MNTPTIASLAAVLALLLCPPAHAEGWSGPYLGLDLTHLRGQDVGTEEYLGTGVPDDWQQVLRPAGTGLGLRAGYNHVLGHRWVVGIEGDYRAYNARGDTTQYNVITGATCTPASHCAFQTRLHQSWSLTARAGVLAHQRLLLFASMGLAHFRIGRTVHDGYASPATDEHDTTWQSGLQLGLGAEYRFSNRFSGTVQIRRADLRRHLLTVNAYGGASERFRLKQDELSLGVNVRF